MRVIRREQPANSNIEQFQDHLQKQQKLRVNARQKAQELAAMSEQLKIDKKTAQTDAERLRIEQDKQRVDSTQKLVDTAFKHFDEAEDAQNFIYRVAMYFDVPGVFKRNPNLLKGMGKSPEGRLKEATAQKAAQQARLYRSGADWYQSKLPRAGSSTQARQQQMPTLEPGQAPQMDRMPTQSRTRALDDESSMYSRKPGSFGTHITGMNSSSGMPEITDYDSLYDQEYIKGLGRSDAKPLSAGDNRILAAAETIRRSVSDVKRVLENEIGEPHLHEQLITDYGEPLFAPGATKKLVLAVNKMKNLLPFARGGKQLTPFEAKLVFRLLNIRGKSANQILRDFDIYVNEFNTLEAGVLGSRRQMRERVARRRSIFDSSYEELTGDTAREPTEEELKTFFPAGIIDWDAENKKSGKGSFETFMNVVNGGG